MTERVKSQFSSNLPNSDRLSLLDQAILATKQTDPHLTKQLLATLTKSVTSGIVTWNINVSKTITDAINELDKRLSHQLSLIMHDPIFSKLEGAWRGLYYLVMNTETNSYLHLKMMPVKKKELFKDLDKSIEFDQSQLFKKIYEAQYGSAGGQPVAALVGDYQFCNQPDDIGMLRHLSSVCAASFCPFISSASPELFGFDSWENLSKPRDLEKIFDGPQYAQWQSFRETDDSRFVVLTMPRVMARLPYGSAYKCAEGVNFEEFSYGKKNFCWMNSAYVYGVTLTQAFTKYGWCTAIRGAENGGKVDHLPLYTYINDSGDAVYQCPTEVAITDRRETELSKLGFLPLCHYKNTSYAVWFGAQTVQKPKVYNAASATDNAAISARMPYIMATSRFAHYLKIIARDKIGSFMDAKDAETWLNQWILKYANANQNGNAHMKAKYPLSDARVEVKEVSGQPGVYQAVVWLRPWLQMEALTTSMRLVARIPQMN